MKCMRAYAWWRISFLTKNMYWKNMHALNMALKLTFYVHDNKYFVPMMKTRDPRINGSPFSPKMTAKWWAPTPITDARNVANARFNPFVRAPPKNKKKLTQNKKEKKEKRIIFTRLINLITHNSQLPKYHTVKS